MTGSGMNTVRINNEVKHISELDSETLSLEWNKLKNENNELYRCIKAKFAQRAENVKLAL